MNLQLLFITAVAVVVRDGITRHRHSVDKVAAEMEQPQITVQDLQDLMVAVAVVVQEVVVQEVVEPVLSM
jgi:hypothetical protein